MTHLAMSVLLFIIMIILTKRLTSLKIKIKAKINIIKGKTGIFHPVACYGSDNPSITTLAFSFYYPSIIPEPNEPTLSRQPHPSNSRAARSAKVSSRLERVGLSEKASPR